MFIFLRPLRDGLTFPGFNAYFSAFVIVIMALWCARMLIRGETIRYPVPIALFGAFLLTAYATGFATISYDPTHRGLHQIAVYFLLFVLATNGLRTQRAVNIVIAAICVTWLLTAAWSIFHFYIMLPGMRQVLMGNPGVVQQYFDGMISPELKNRLEANRAFGTFLFPNALGAFAILGIPLLIVASRAAVRRMMNPKAVPAPAHPWQGWFTLGTFVGITTSIVVALYFANDFMGAARPDGEAPISGTYFPFAVFLPFGAAIGGPAAWVVNRRGLCRLGEIVAGIGAPAALAATAFALWLSYSRGAMVALAIVAVLAMWLSSGKRLSVGASRAVAIALIGLHLLAVPATVAQQDVEGYKLPEMLPSRFDYSYVQFLKNQENLGTLDIEGKERSLADLGKLESFQARVTYWQVGLRMFFAHPWTGVGLGNFKQGYLRHQFLGAGDVETAHNDFLQYFCETGIVGGGLFLAFWVYFGVWGARRVLAEEDAAAKRWLVCIYAGTLAFAIHSLVDFNYQNPSIAQLAFIFAGLFYARTGLAAADEPNREITKPLAIRAIAIGMTLLTVVLTASVARVYFFDLGLTEGSMGWRMYYVGDRKAIGNRREVARKIFKELGPGKPADAPPPYLSVQAARMVIPDMAELETIGTYWVRLPEDAGKMRRLSPNEPVTGTTFLMINDPKRAFTLAAEHSERHIKVIEGWDSMYPHDPELATEIFTWYDLLFAHATDPAAKKRYAVEAEQWAKAATDRSPEVAWFWLNYAQALWLRAAVETSEAQRLAYYFTGLDYYRRAHELFPAGGLVAFRYAEALQKLGTALAGAGRKADGDRLLVESDAMFKKAHLLANYTGLVR